MPISVEKDIAFKLHSTYQLQPTTYHVIQPSTVEDDFGKRGQVASIRLPHFILMTPPATGSHKYMFAQDSKKECIAPHKVRS